jgi:hypothetical protein
MEAQEAAMLPERTRCLAFGDVAAVWGMPQKLGVAGLVDEVVGTQPAGLPLSVGAYLALAALNRVVAPCSKLGFARRGLRRRRPAAGADDRRLRRRTELRGQLRPPGRHRRRVTTWQLTGDKPRDLRLTWTIDQAARAGLEEELLGKHVLITEHDDWPVAEVIAAYRSQSEAEFGFGQLPNQQQQPT